MKKLLIVMAALFCSTVGKAGKYPCDIIETRDGGKLKITFFAHSSMMMEYDGKVIYIDPVKDNADYASLPDADLILVTHEHYDHLDIPVVEQLSTPVTLFVGNKAAADQLGSGEAMANGDKKSLPFVQVEAVPAYNITPDRQGFHPPGGRDNGYILTFGGTRVYIAGDTEDTPEMMALKDIDVAFLPVNQPYTMTEEQAARAVKAIIPKIFYPYHYGQTEHKTDIAKLEKLLEGTGVEVRVRPME